MIKKVFFLASAALLMACGKGNKTQHPVNPHDCDSSHTPAVSDTLHFAGEGPAADGSYLYNLSLYGDSLKEAELTVVGMTPKGNDTLAMTVGLVNTFVRGGKTYHRVSENKIDSLTFLQLDDNTLRLVNKDLQESPNKDLNTDLKLVK